MEARLEQDGTLILKVEDRIVATTHAPGLLPIRPGRLTQFSAERLQAGGMKTGVIMGDYAIPNTFNGRILSLELKLED